MKGHETSRLVEDCPAILDHADLWNHHTGPLVITHPTIFPAPAIGIVFVQQDGDRLHVTHEGESCQSPSPICMPLGGRQERSACPAAGRGMETLQACWRVFRLSEVSQAHLSGTAKHRCFDEEAPVNPMAHLEPGYR